MSANINLSDSHVNGNKTQFVNMSVIEQVENDFTKICHKIMLFPPKAERNEDFLEGMAHLSKWKGDFDEGVKLVQAFVTKHNLPLQKKWP